ncbi:monovalent cation:H+ antiporter, CPA1 (nhx1) [Coemansia sp. RSA 1933]|nr:monovalent cation:H+ antiporter, CPA1 (nhx1) [Coemansia sp. RSA 1933]
MLRRVERGNVWLPHADDGTPLRLQQPGTSSRRKPSERERQAQDSPPGNGFGAYKKQRWMQMAFGSVAHGIRVAGLWFKELVCGLVQRLWAAALLCIRVATSTAMERVQDTRAGAVIGAVVNAAASVASGIRDRAGGVWETVLSPLLYYVSLGASALVGGASFAVSIVNSILGSLLLPGKNASVAQVGVTGAVPPLFISEYWDSAAMSGSSPAIQRLRPELWPHVFGGNPDGATFLYDVVKAPQPQQQRQIQQQQQPAATAVPWRKEDLRPGSLSANSDSSASQNWNPEDATASAVDTAASAPGAAAGQQEHAAGTAEADDESGSQRQARKAWTTLDWLLAAYRVALSVIALRTVFRPSRSSRMFVLVLVATTTTALLLSTTVVADLVSSSMFLAEAVGGSGAAPAVRATAAPDEASSDAMYERLVTTTAAASSEGEKEPDDAEEPPPEDEEKVSSQALLILVSLLIAALLTSYYLQRWKIRSVHETVLSIFAGMVVGLVLRFSTGSYIKRIVTFDHTIFFNMLLPPIILNCGYNLQKTSVARNIPAVLTFAFIGTAISAIVIGVLVQIYSFTGIESIGFSFLDSLILGTILSATDPVTILAVFEQLRVDPKLFSIIFGETVFNDAVAIVLFETLGMLRSSGQGLSFGAVPSMLSSFMFVFTASLLVGVATGVLMALLCKHTRLYEFASIEASLVMLVAYQTYLFSNAIKLSGIVSLLFCAATMRQYAYKSLSKKSKRATRYIFHLLSGLAENFVFIYLGIALFTSPELRFRPVFIVFVMVSTCISRYSAIFPLSRVLNAIFKFRHPSAPSSAQPVTHEEQTMLFWAGLRGAVAVALASEVSGDNGTLLRTTVLCVVVLSVGIFGGTTPKVVELLGIRTGVPQPDSSDEDENDDGDDSNDDASDAYNSPSSDDNSVRRPVIDLSSRQQPWSPKTASSSSGRAMRPSSAYSQMNNHTTLDMPSGPSMEARAVEALQSSQDEQQQQQQQQQQGEPVALGRIPRSFRYLSSLNETGESWIARIKNSYRSLDRSLIYDLDRDYIQPFLVRQEERRALSNAATVSHSNRTRPNNRSYIHQQQSESTGSRWSSGASPSMVGSRRTQQNSELFIRTDSQSQSTPPSDNLESSPWASYIPEEADGETWESSASDLGSSRHNRSHQQQQPLLKKST